MPERRRRRWPLILAVVTALLVVCCCSGGLWVRDNGMPFLEPEDKEPSLYIRNDRPETIRIRIVEPSGELADDIPAGTMHSFGRGASCDATRIEALSSAGLVLGVLDNGGCVTQTWIVTAEGTTRMEPGRVEHS